MYVLSAQKQLRRDEGFSIISHPLDLAQENVFWLGEDWPHDFQDFQEETLLVKGWKR